MRSHTIDGEKLRSERELCGMSAADLAKESGTTTAFIYMVERGIRQPKAKTAGLMAKALGKEVKDLIADDTAKAKVGEPK